MEHPLLRVAVKRNVATDVTLIHHSTTARESDRGMNFGREFDPGGSFGSESRGQSPAAQAHRPLTAAVDSFPLPAPRRPSSAARWIESMGEVGHGALRL